MTLHLSSSEDYRDRKLMSFGFHFCLLGDCEVHYLFHRKKLMSPYKCSNIDQSPSIQCSHFESVLCPSEEYLKFFQTFVKRFLCSLYYSEVTTALNKLSN